MPSMMRSGMPDIRTETTTSLYDLLADPAPSGALAGETSLTATKETVDGDSESVSDDDVLDLRGGW
jgi:hypothetical protein